MRDLYMAEIYRPESMGLSSFASTRQQAPDKSIA